VVDRLVPLATVGLLSTALSACGGTSSTNTTMLERTSSVSAAPAPPQKGASTVLGPPQKGTSTVPGPPKTGALTVPSSPRRGASTIPTPAAGEGSEEPKTVPDETGVRLGVAAKDLRRRGMLFKVVGDGVSGVTAKSTWAVCGTNPLPHSYIEVGTTIYLTVAQSCG
jgi:hypothetical protein